MGQQKELIFNKKLKKDSLNFSDFFGNADYLYLTSDSIPDWSNTGDFIEVDCDLLITLEGGIKRKIPIPEIYASTRDIIRIPQEFSRSGCLMELVMQASFSVNLKVWAVSVSSEFDVISRLQAIEERLEDIEDYLGVIRGRGRSPWDWSRFLP